MTGSDYAEKRIGQTLAGKWRVERVLDHGGMAVVLAARDPNGAPVAVKMLHPHIATNAEVRTRFLREGYVANHVDHRGAVRITGDGVTDDGLAFLVMELLEGESLEHILNRSEGRAPCADILAITEQVLDVLEAFHARGVIHRDLKPANLFVTREGVVKVLDFGFASMHSARSTEDGIVIGTVSYMAPEQAQARPVDIDERTDVYEIGAVMFQSLTGRLFVEGETMIQRLMHVMKKPAPKIATFMPTLPAYVADIVDRALAFDKKDRWESAGDMRHAVRRAYQALVRDVKKSAALAEEVRAAVLEQSAVARVSFPRSQSRR